MHVSFTRARTFGDTEMESEMENEGKNNSTNNTAQWELMMPVLQELRSGINLNL